MNDQQLQDIQRAINLLETTNLAVKMANVVGTPIEKALAHLPDPVREAIDNAAQKAITTALDVAVSTMNNTQEPSENLPESSDWWHKAAIAVSGAAGGAFGAIALTIELPISTTIIMRSIADIARSEGSDVNSIDMQLECVNVLALGAPSSSDDASEIGYFVARTGLQNATRSAAEHIAKNGLKEKSAPPLAKLLIRIAERFSISVTEKAAAQAVPIIGAVGGALINTIFMDHFQNMARGHFIIIRLESQLGQDVVQAKYLELAKKKRN